MLRLDSRDIWTPHVFEEDTLLRREIESQITSGAAADDTQVVVQGPPNDIIRHGAQTVDLESKSWVDLPVSNAALQSFDLDLCYGGVEHFDFLWSSGDCSRIQSTLFGRQLVEPLKEFDDEVVAL